MCVSNNKLRLYTTLLVWFNVINDEIQRNEKKRRRIALAKQDKTDWNEWQFSEKKQARNLCDRKNVDFGTNARTEA